MLLNMFAVYDAKANAFIQPFFLPNKAMAIRTFSECANNPKHQFCLHPSDFTLFELGTFDNETGLIETLPAHNPLGLAIEFQENATRYDNLEEEIEVNSNQSYSDRRIPEGTVIQGGKS